MKLNTKKIASIQAANAGTPCELFTVSVIGYNRQTFCFTYLPYIVAAGRKGGSNVAAAIVNALMYLKRGDRR